MSLWYACTCKICEKDYSVECYSSTKSERECCKECLLLQQQKKREEYFSSKNVK